MLTTRAIHNARLFANMARIGTAKPGLTSIQSMLSNCLLWLKLLSTALTGKLPRFRFGLLNATEQRCALKSVV